MRVALIFLLAAVALGCDDGRPTLLVWAAASLSDTLPAAGATFREREDRDIEHSFAASNRLARQISEGARADVFISADRAWVEHLDEGGFLRPESQRRIIGNRLVVVVPRSADAPERLDELIDAVERFGLAGEGVPAGRYADAALARAGLSERAREKVVRGGSVRAVLSWVADGEVDAGIVYATDAAAERRVRVVVALEPNALPPVNYWGAVTREAESPEAGLRYLDFLRERATVALFERHGFTGE